MLAYQCLNSARSEKGHSLVRFPAGFLWGTGTAAHQVEGHNAASDWWEWECTGSKIKNGDSSWIACDWWNGRYKQDLALARSLGQNSHRLSIEWSRLEQHPGEWNREALAVYRDMLTYLHHLGMVPLVTLHHFTNPIWLTKAGGWENEAVVPAFRRFAERVVRELGDLCSRWVTINEPNALATLSYCAGMWPPERSGLTCGIRVMTNQVRAHAAAYSAIKREQPDAQIGMAHRFQVFTPNNPDSPMDRFAARLRDFLFNRLIFTAVEEGTLRLPWGITVPLPDAKGTQDWIGVNYYFSEGAAFDLRRPELLFARRVLDPRSSQWQSDFAGAGNIDPGSFQHLLKELSVYHKPIYITENGMFEAKGADQSKYLLAHLAALHRAIGAGADVRGYYWWSLVDNFEWSEGYTPRFGLYRVNRATQERIAKPVARVYEQVAKANALPNVPDDFEPKEEQFLNDAEMTLTNQTA